MLARFSCTTRTRWLATARIFLARIILSGFVLVGTVGAVAGGEGDFEFDELVPLSLGALAVGDRQKGL